MLLHGLPHGAIEHLLQGQPSHKSLANVSASCVKRLHWVNLEFRRDDSEREAALETTVEAVPSGKWTCHLTALGPLSSCIYTTSSPSTLSRPYIYPYFTVTW
jgi:hypothetical protein